MLFWVGRFGDLPPNRYKIGQREPKIGSKGH